MKILQISTESSVQKAFVLPIARHLRDRGHQVVLACSDEAGEAGRSFVPELRSLGFEVLVVPMTRTISPWADSRAVLSLYQQLRGRHFDVVHAQTAKAGMIGRVAGRLARVPVIVYTAHAFPFHEYLSPMRAQSYALLERIGARLCDAIVVDSEAVRRRGIEFKLAAPEKIRVIPMGIDTERFNPDRHRADRAQIRADLGLRPDGVVIGAVARLVADKGLDCFLRAVALCVDQFPDLQCVILGDGPLRSELQALASSLGLGKKVVFAGYRTDIPRQLAAIDVYMLPTRREGFGVAFAEAMSMEVPVVASRIPPIDEIVVEAETGSLASVDDSRDFARALMPLLAKPDLRQKMGQAGRRRVREQFEQRLMCEAYERVFQEYCGPGERRAEMSNQAPRPGW